MPTNNGYLPVACPECHTIWVTKHSGTKPCRNCNAELIVYDVDEPKPQMKFKCPSCGNIEMEFESRGNWA